MAARLIRQLRRGTLLSSSAKTSIPQLRPQNQFQRLNIFPLHQTQRRFYISEMRKSAFDENILRMLRREIQYEFDQSPPKQPVTTFNSFTIDDLPGEQWMKLKKKFGENEEIKVEATMFDAVIPIQKSVGDGGKRVPEDVKLHITLVVNISKEGVGEVLEIMCSAWPNSIEITKLFIRRNGKMSAQLYDGPEFRELDDELQESLYEFLEARGINEELATFLHEYMKNKGKIEYIRWMGTVKSYIENK
ncbi:mitochondrial glycoprotein [Tripterygium wilfordii]|uniref:Mitochondrial glycoprotein n=1 Tax=Tripterygium wilfordii TaxID=458696 RepID=A0A7J7D5Y6_TRIWF|nr:uncharacterized protein At2g39795, mitochondrial-like [Tripterygium wilfordii]KAF5741770.1 mitochondrial glycoprotein [Tripterygium wilfordii]